MQIDIHDVGHGGCAVVQCPNGTRIMVDCGYDSERPWYPSVAYSGQFIDGLILSNLDEDHLDDLPYLWDRATIGSIFSNPSVTAAALKAMKPKGMKMGVQKAHAIIANLGAGMVGNLPVTGEVHVWGYWNRYGLAFRDTNNLSVATFFRWNGFTILFAGDLEEKGWRALLRIPGFSDDLATVTVLVASHHGRDNGRCDDVFRVMWPEIVIFSDCRKQHETQETDAWYRRRVKGIIDLDRQPTGLLPPRRHVLTTRRDGTISIQVEANGQYLVSRSRAVPTITPIRLPSLFERPGILA